MRYTTVGRSRLEVSQLCLGTMNIGRFADRDQSFALLDAAVDVGINFVDTANSYGVQGERGLTERIIGEWFNRSGRRDQVVLATKLYEAQDDWPNSGGLSALNIRKACDASLRRLGTDYIDVLQMHHVDRRAPWEEVWEAFSVLRDQGKILYAGSSNFAAWQLVVAQGAARELGSFGLISEQSVYNLTQRSIELEVVPALEHLGAGLLAWSPLAGGLLGAPPSEAVASEGRRADPAFRARQQEQAEALEQAAEAARGFGLTLAQAAIGWLLAQPVLTAAIIGPRNADQLVQLATSLDGHAERDALWRDLDSLFPGPGAAPEAYAW